MDLAASKSRDLAYIGMFAVLITITSWISIPTAVPFTLQTFGIFVTVGLLGGKRGSMAVLLYLFMGFTGLPVFAGFRGGPGVLLGNTGGYLLGFLLSALFMWLTERLYKRTFVTFFISMIAGQAICYAFGTLWFLYLYGRTTGSMGITAVLSWCVIPFLIPDLLKMILAAGVTRKLLPVFRRF